MSFVFPGFLFGLFVLLVPVIIHLFSFRKIRKVHFSNLRFLTAVEQKSSAARRLKRFWLLSLRCLALLFLVLAFSQPYLPSEGTVSAQGKKAVSIYIDNSYSMEVESREGSLLEEAKRRAKEIASAYGLNDQFQLLTNDFGGRHQRLLNYEDFLSALDEIRVSANRRTLQEVIKLQESCLDRAQGRTGTAYLISDFQRNLISDDSLSNNVPVRLVRLRAPEQANVSVDSAWFVSPVHRAGEAERLIVRVRNNSDKETGSVPLRLLVEKQQKAISSVTLPARATINDTLSFSGLTQGWKQGEIRVGDYPITFDDRYFISFQVRPSMKILSIDAGNQGNEYIEALYGTEDFFDLRTENAGQLNYSKLAAYPFLVLNGTKGVTGGFVAAIKQYVKNGGSIMIFPSLDDIHGLGSLCSALNTGVPEGVETVPAKVQNVQYQSPMFRGVFDHIPRNVELPIARKYVLFSTNSQGWGAAVMKLPASRPFLSRHTLGRGTVYLAAVSLSEESSNFVRHALFVPVMYQAAFLSLHDRALSYTIGRDLFLETEPLRLAGNEVLRLRNEKAEIIPDVRQAESGTRLFIADQISEAGQYQLSKSDSLLSIVAFNNDRSESDLSYLDEDELRDRFNGNDVRLFDPYNEPLKNSVKAVNYGVQLWKVCLILTLIFLAAEILLLRFYGRSASTLQQGT
ncbi:BatA domain-containing protein [Arcticibacter sp. MXS-1]|uniref:BatA domain-containing protein n=1 Tax=Arcticibacter sp. MXS-1 TaxID=3341726 RepID=UPI0035A9AD5D